jgi:hypothetical protein
MFFQLLERNYSNIKKKNKKMRLRTTLKNPRRKHKEIKPLNLVVKEAEIKQEVKQRKEEADVAE